jgi:hypothetical protein
LRVVAPFKRGIDEIRAATAEGRGPHPLSLPYDMDFCFEYRKPCEALEPMCKGHFDPTQLVSAGYSGAVTGGNGMGFLDATANGQMPAPLNGHAPQGFAPQAPAFQPPPTQGYQPPPANQQAPQFAPQQAAPQFAPPPVQQQAPQYTPPPAQGYTPGVNPPEAHAAYGTAPMPGYPGAQPAQQQAPQYAPPAPSFAPQVVPGSFAPQVVPSPTGPAPQFVVIKPTRDEVIAAIRVLASFLGE